MFDTKLSKKAYVFSCMVHTSQLDLGGKPYICHPMAVANNFKDERFQAVALLHDTIEDNHHFSEKDLREHFPDDVVDAVMLLTHRDDGLTYMEYIRKIKDSGNVMAIEVKKADLRHNMDMFRLAELDERAFSRLKRYKKALNLLES